MAKKRGINKGGAGMSPLGKKKEYPISSLAYAGSGLDNWADIQNDFAVVLVVVFMIAQIRAYNPGVPGNEIDALPSVKFFRQVITQDGWARALAAVLAIGLTLDQIDLNEKDAVENAAASLVQDYKGNVSFIDHLTSSNVRQFRMGVMSRVLGWLPSCPVTNMSLLGIDPKLVISLDLDGVLKLIGFGDAGIVKQRLQETVLLGSRAFKEPGLPSMAEYGGRTKLEQEVFGDSFTRTEPTTLKTVVGKGGIVPLAAINQEILDTCLNTLERGAYRAAVNNGNQKKVKELSDLASARWQEKLASGDALAMGSAPKPLKEVTAAKPITKSATKDQIAKAILALGHPAGGLINMTSPKGPLWDAYVMLKNKPNCSADDLVTIPKLGINKSGSPETPPDEQGPKEGSSS